MHTEYYRLTNVSYKEGTKLDLKSWIYIAFLFISMLTECAAVEIYKMKIALLRCKKSIWGQTRSVAKLFGVNSRTVKYVWNRQTWGHATEHLWGSESEIEIQELSDSLHSKMVIKFCHRFTMLFVVFAADFELRPG